MRRAPESSLFPWKGWRFVDRPLSVQFLIAGGIVFFGFLVSLAVLFSQSISHGIRVMVVLHFILLVVFITVLTHLYYSIARPISDISNGMNQYRKGDFKTRVSVTNSSQTGFLATSFNEMAETIETMVADLKKLDELKTDFISTVSHELRTPLTSIGGYVKLLIGEEAGPVTDIQKEFLQIVDINVVRLTHLINEFLDIEALQSGKLHLERESVDMNEILKECRDTFGVVATQKGLEMQYEVPHLQGPVLGDKIRLVQVFLNLLSNAIKYTKVGYVGIQAEQNNLAIVVRIRDSGVGLTQGEQERLFQKFYRARGGLTSSEGGTGLGLVIVRELVESHGGRVGVESEPGRGTEFSVTLPLAPSEESI